MEFLGQYPPSPELDKSFLTKYADYNLHTLYRYTHMIKGFMKWYGEPLVDVNIKVPKTLPPYTEDVDIEKLLDAVVDKKTHKGVIARDKLRGSLVGFRRLYFCSFFLFKFRETARRPNYQDRNTSRTKYFICYTTHRPT
jgi:integrase